MKRTLERLLSILMLISICVVHTAAAQWECDETPAETGWEMAEGTPGSVFWDVAPDAYYAHAVDWALQRGITSGIGDGAFGPDLGCTTGQIITFLWKASGGPEPTIQNPFSDVIPGCYYYSAALWAAETGLTAGPVFGPDRPCTRSAVVTYLWKLAGRPQAAQEMPEPTQIWSLLLANPWNPLPEGYEVPLTELEGGYYVDARCVQQARQMLEDCRAAGISPVICSAYRTWDKQEELYQNEVAAYMALGVPREEAEVRAARAVAVPGTSEHQTGLALDLVDEQNWNLDASQESTPTQQWLMEHSWEYGFVLRYPNQKSEVTGIIYEPWHYRYVGQETARVLREQGMCLEEYLQHLVEYEQAVAWAMEEGITASADPFAFAPNQTCTRAQIVTFLHHSIM